MTNLKEWAKQYHEDETAFAQDHLEILGEKAREMREYHFDRIDRNAGIVKNKEIAILLALDDAVEMYDEFNLYGYEEFDIRYYHRHFHYTIKFETEARKKSLNCFGDMFFDSIGGFFNSICGGSRPENNNELFVHATRERVEQIRNY